MRLIGYGWNLDIHAVIATFNIYISIRHGQYINNIINNEGLLSKCQQTKCTVFKTTFLIMFIKTEQILCQSKTDIIKLLHPAVSEL